MSIWKKAISVATSAALLASLLTAVAAPAAFASIAQTSAGNVAQSTTSAGEATFLFTENAVGALTATGHMYVDITPAADSAANDPYNTCTPVAPADYCGSVTWAGTPVVSAPDSLGVTVSIVGSRLDIRIRGFDNANVETISITGLKVRASSDATPGAVRATLSDDNAVPGTIYNAFVPATVTATGTLQTIVIPNTWLSINTTSVCGFQPTAGLNGTATFGTQTGLTVTSVNGTAPGLQDVIIAAPGLTGSHVIGETVTQTVANCSPTALASPATVVRAADYYATSIPTAYPGENNNPAGNLYVDEPLGGFLTAGTTLTYTIVTDGVVFSRAPRVQDDNGTMTVSIGSLSADRKTVVVTVGTASPVPPGLPAEVTLYDILYDVAASVPGGTYVEVSLTISGGKLAVGSPAANAIVFRGINATAPTPTVYIGENNQPTGLVTLTEQGAGFFNSGTGSNNTLAVCTTAVNYSFTVAPWAKVTAGDLRLREGTVASPDNIVQGAWDGDNCYTWTVWTGSTTPSTIQIGNADFTSGPLINVAPGQAPGLVSMNVYSGNSLNYDQTRIAVVGFAVAAFRSQVAVTALSQPLIPAGAKSKAGAIQIAETANGQLKRWEAICVEIVPRGSVGSIQAKYDTVIQALNTAELPTVTATGGLVVSPVELTDEDCFGKEPNGRGPGMGTGTYSLSFSFDVLQQSTAGNGKLVIDNINLLTLADAANGPVLMNVYGYGQSNTQVDFQAQVSNARIGVKSAIAMSAVTALGVPPNQGPWSTATKVAAANKFITWRFSGGAALAGKTVRIYVATKNANGGWGPFVNLTGRVADASGNVYFWWRATGAWVSVRAYFPGDASYNASWSPARQGRWLS